MCIIISLETIEILANGKTTIDDDYESIHDQVQCTCMHGLLSFMLTIIYSTVHLYALDVYKYINTLYIHSDLQKFCNYRMHCG